MKELRMDRKCYLCGIKGTVRKWKIFKDVDGKPFWLSTCPDCTVLKAHNKLDGKQTNVLVSTIRVSPNARLLTYVEVIED